MTDNPLYHQDDPNQPMWPPSSPQPGQQGKLVLGGFQDPQKRVERKPYQYAPQQNEDATIYPQRPGQQRSPGGMSAPAANPNVQPYPYRQPGQMPGPGGAPIAQPPPPRRRRRGCLITTLVVLLLLCVVGGFTFTTAQRVLAFGSAISTQTPLSSQTGYLGGSDRVNLLVMGFGGSGHDGDEPAAAESPYHTGLYSTRPVGADSA